MYPFNSNEGAPFYVTVRLHFDKAYAVNEIHGMYHIAEAFPVYLIQILQGHSSSLVHKLPYCPPRPSE